MDIANRAVGLFLAIGCAAGVAWLPQSADAAGIDATVSHRNLKDGPVQVELFSGAVEQGTTPYVSLSPASGLVRLRLEHISKATEISCRVGKGEVSDKEGTAFRITEHVDKEGELFSTGKVVTIDAGEIALLQFIVVPGSKGTHVYSIESVADVKTRFIDCTVRTLGDDAGRTAPKGRRAAKRRARSGGGSGPGATPTRISGKRTLRKMSRRALTKARFDRSTRTPKSPGRSTPPPPATSHTFGAFKFVSDSNEAKIYVATFSSLTQEGLSMLANESLTGGITVPKGKSAIVDCAIEGLESASAPLVLQVEHFGGPTATHPLDSGGQRLVFGLSRTIGLETFTLRNVGSPYARWTLGQCEVSFQ